MAVVTATVPGERARRRVRLADAVARGRPMTWRTSAMKRFNLIRLGGAATLTQDGSGTLLPEMFAPDRYNGGW